MNQGTPEGGCPECGAIVGHRMIRLPDVGSSSWTTEGYRACSLGLDAVPRAEHERVKSDIEALSNVVTLFAKHRRELLENLTATQKRCTELLEEVRRLQKEEGRARAVQVALMTEIRDLRAALGET